MKKLGFLALLLLVLTVATSIAIAEPSGYEPGASRKVIAQHVPGNQISQVYCAATLDDGLVAIMDNGSVCYYENQQLITQVWHDTSEEDFFIRVGECYPNANYDLCAKLGDEIVSFGDNFMEIELSFLTDFDFSGSRWYAYGLYDRTLTYWSPYVKSLVARNVDDVFTVDGITFLQAEEGAFVLEVSPYYYGTNTQEFCNYHPVDVIFLGPGNMYDYVYELTDGEFYGTITPGTEEEIQGRNTAFLRKYGVDFANWGSHKSNFTLNDFITIAGKRPAEIKTMFGAPSVDNSKMFGYDNITFDDRDGNLRFHLDEFEEVYRIVWTSSTYSKDLFERFKQRFETIGTYAWTRETREGKVEIGYNIEGRVVFVCYQDNGSQQSVYVFAYYDIRNEQP